MASPELGRVNVEQKNRTTITISYIKNHSLFKQISCVLILIVLVSPRNGGPFFGREVTTSNLVALCGEILVVRSTVQHGSNLYSTTRTSGFVWPYI